MKRAFLLAALLAILLSVGCGKKGAGMSGTFKRKPPLPEGDVTMTFQEDGTFVFSDTRRADKGTYKLEGRKLTVTMTEVNGKPPQGWDQKPITGTLSEDGKSFNPAYAQGIEFIKQE